MKIKRTSTNLKYRPDVDGLRAIAVCGVIIYHYFPTLLQSGFIGVDVFFVISGYLVTGIIYPQLANNNFEFKNFYYKRVRRLFPSLILILSTTLAAGFVFLTARELRDLGKHIFSSTFFLSNFLLLLEEGYFNKSAELKPLLHIWSLAIEEQFYLIWPFLMFLSYKWKKSALLIVTWSIVILSFLINIFFSYWNGELLVPFSSWILSHLSVAFYMIPSRLWELAAGGGVALLTYNKQFKKTHVFHSLISLIGFLSILISMVLIKKENVFPGFWALLPVLGTISVVLSDECTATNKFLSNKLLVYIGLISYPLYLWHWPLISFASIIFPNSLNLTIKLALILLSFLLAIFTYEFIEKPFKKMSLSTKNMIFILSLLFAVGILGLFTYFKNGFPSRYPTTEEGYSKSAYRDEPSLVDIEKCRKKFLTLESCLISNIALPPTVVLMGDSHAHHLYAGLKKIYDIKGENLLFLSIPSTPPLIDFYFNERSREVSIKVFELIQGLPSVKKVLLSSFWGMYLEEKENVYFNRPTPMRPEVDFANLGRFGSFKDALFKTLTYLSSLNKKVVIFYDTPSLPYRLDSCFERPLFKNSFPCKFPISQELEKQYVYRSIFKQAEELVNSKSLKIIDPLSILCAEEFCWATNAGKSLYFDNDHLTADGAIYLIEEMVKRNLLD